jgi:hypothetical protein
MSIAIHVHDRNPGALAELIVATTLGGVVFEVDAQLGHLSAVVASQEREAEYRRATWHWLNSMSKALDRDNDWSEI